MPTSVFTFFLSTTTNNIVHKNICLNSQLGKRTLAQPCMGCMSSGQTFYGLVSLWSARNKKDEDASLSKYTPYCSLDGENAICGSYLITLLRSNDTQLACVILYCRIQMCSKGNCKITFKFPVHRCTICVNINIWYNQTCMHQLFWKKEEGYLKFGFILYLQC